jgi:hypothetical protein
MADAESPRRFQRLRPDASEASGLSNVSRGGFCLSVFLLIHPPGRPTEVLLGQVDPTFAWDRVGALDTGRVRSVLGKWMLPSSHLIEFEEPAAAARRVATEQLEAPEVRLHGPDVHSEAYPTGGAEPGLLHWDLHFVFEGEWPAGRALRARPFTELRFFSPQAPPPGRIARGGGDVLRLSGLPFPDST